MIYHVTYANDEMTKSAILAQNSALKHGCDRSFIMNEKSFSSEFLKLNEEILKQDRGAGYWIWKPYVIFNMLNKISENDILVYTDAGIEIINDINHLINKMDQDVFLFGNNYPHIEWCKADVMDGILQNWELEFDVNNRQAQASDCKKYGGFSDIYR
jgi:hypothetical protein